MLCASKGISRKLPNNSPQSVMGIIQDRNFRVGVVGANMLSKQAVRPDR